MTSAVTVDSLPEPGPRPALADDAANRSKRRGRSRKRKSRDTVSNGNNCKKRTFDDFFNFCSFVLAYEEQLERQALTTGDPPLTPPPNTHTVTTHTDHTITPHSDHTSTHHTDYSITPHSDHISTPHTSTPPNNHTGTPPTNHTGTPHTDNTSTPPTDHTGTPPTDHTGTPPTNHSSTPPTDHSSTPPTDHTSTPPTDHTSTPPTNTPHTDHNNTPHSDHTGTPHSDHTGTPHSDHSSTTHTHHTSSSDSGESGEERGASLPLTPPPDASNDKLEYTSEDESWNLVTCFCRRPFAGRPMIECSKCDTWVHLFCAKIRKNAVPEVYTCPKCQTPRPNAGKITTRRTSL